MIEQLSIPPGQLKVFFYLIGLIAVVLLALLAPSIRHWYRKAQRRRRDRNRG